jgi:hypothetical protein
MLRLILRQLLLDTRFPLTDSALATLRSHVFAFVDERKLDGWAPEQIILAIKRTADEAGMRPLPNGAVPGEPVRPMDALLIKMVGWSVERYYGRPPRNDLGPEARP